jgi:hypothetical protein
MIEFRTMLGPRPVQSPFTLELYYLLPFLFYDLFVGSGDRSVSSFGLWFFALALESDFYHVGRICYKNAKGSRR